MLGLFFPSLQGALPAAAVFPRSAFRVAPLKYRSASAAQHREGPFFAWAWLQRRRRKYKQAHLEKK